MACWYGRPQYTMFYNDAYRPVLGRARHPEWFGRSGKEPDHDRCIEVHSDGPGRGSEFTVSLPAAI